MTQTEADRQFVGILEAAFRGLAAAVFLCRDTDPPPGVGEARALHAAILGRLDAAGARVSRAEAARRLARECLLLAGEFEKSAALSEKGDA